MAAAMPIAGNSICGGGIASAAAECRGQGWGGMWLEQEPGDGSVRVSSSPAPLGPLGLFSEEEEKGKGECETRS